MKTSFKIIVGIGIVSICIAPIVIKSYAQSMSGMDMSIHVKGLSKISKAIAILRPTKANTAQGKVTFTQVDGGIRVQADIQNLSLGVHGFHIHEFGDVSSEDGASAGGHFNPKGLSHGAPSADVRHEGDLGNITADSTGHAVLDFIDNQISFESDYSIIGHAVVVHANADDMTTQPTGNAGPRVAYGVIGIAK